MSRWEAAAGFLCCTWRSHNFSIFERPFRECLPALRLCCSLQEALEQLREKQRAVYNVQLVALRHAVLHALCALCSCPELVAAEAPPLKAGSKAAGGGGSSQAEGFLPGVTPLRVASSSSISNFAQILAQTRWLLLPLQSWCVLCGSSTSSRPSARRRCWGLMAGPRPLPSAPLLLISGTTQQVRWSSKLDC